MEQEQKQEQIQEQIQEQTNNSDIDNTISEILQKHNISTEPIEEIPSETIPKRRKRSKIPIGSVLAIDIKILFSFLFNQEIEQKDIEELNNCLGDSIELVLNKYIKEFNYIEETYLSLSIIGIVLLILKKIKDKRNESNNIRDGGDRKNISTQTNSTPINQEK